MDTLSDERVLEIIAGCEGVTPGPWTAFYKHKYDEYHVGVGSGAMKLALFSDGCPTENPQLDSEHIARLDPQTVSSLATELLALRKRVGELEAKLAAPDWYWPAEDTSEDACAFSASEVLDDTPPGKIVVVVRGGIVETMYCAFLPAADALSSLVRERDAKHAMFLYEADKHSEWLEKFMAMKAKCEAAEADAARMREALEPFAEFGRRNVDDHGWKSNIHREGISVWFGPSEFRAAWVARNALGGKDAV